MSAEESCGLLLMEKTNQDWSTKTYRKARQFLTDAGFKAVKINV